jgi:segregation and condensation protein A
MHFCVKLDMFLGPLDLLLYLVRKHELDVAEIPIAAVTEQYLEFLAVLEQIDVNAVGEFLEVASTLIEMKSRLVLPGEDEVTAELEDPRQELVRRLLEFKRYRDAASMLEERGRQWRERYARRANDIPTRTWSLDQQPIHEVELWDLVSAFGRVLKAQFAAGSGPENIRYDETPIHIYMRRIGERLQRDGRVAFTSFFDAVAARSTLVGMFLAVLELVRHRHARATQLETFGEIWLEPGDEPVPDEFAAIDNYEHAGPAGEAA